MFSSLRVLLLCSFVAAVVTKGAAAVATTKHFCYSTPTLLGGGLTSYRTPSDASACKGGYASSDAWVRRFRVQGEPTVHLMPLDFLSSFTQMHALKWDVNALFYSHYNASSWLALPSILYGANNPKMSLLRRDGFPWILTNIDIPLNSGFLDYRKVAWVDAATAIGYIVIAPTTDGMSLDDVLQCAYRGLEEVCTFGHSSLTNGTAVATRIPRSPSLEMLNCTFDIWCEGPLRSGLAWPSGGNSSVPVALAFRVVQRSRDDC